MIGNEIGYTECDNSDCEYWNSVQPIMGRYTCKGILPKDRAAGSEDDSSCHDAADDELEVSKWSDDSDDEQPVSRLRCPGTFRVSAKQAYYASHLFCAAGSHRCKRTHCKRDKATKKAAREARSRAVKLAKEVEKEVKRELMEKEKQRKKEWLDDLRKEGERAWGKPRKEQEKQLVQQPAQPVKRLKRETRRLPVIVRTPVACDAASESSTLVDHSTDTDETAYSPPPSPPPSAPTTPTTPGLRRRNTPPRPRPTGIVWDESWSTLPARRAPQAQYPLISRSPDKSRTTASPDTSTTTLPDISSLSISPLPARNKKRSGARVGAGYARSYGALRPLRVSYKNGMVITHFGTLLPPREASQTGGKGVKSKSQSRVYRGPGQRRYLILSKVDVLEKTVW